MSHEFSGLMNHNTMKIENHQQTQTQTQTQLAYDLLGTKTRTYPMAMCKTSSEH